MTETQKQIYTFLGLPAAGKGTQAEIFARNHDYEIVGVGNLVRDEIKNGDPADPRVKTITDLYNQGKPAPDEIVNELMGKKLDSFIASDKRGIILDNFPFTSPQADYLSNYTTEKGLDLPIIVNVKVAPETVVDRITRRKICPKCGGIYKDGEEICPKDGEKLIVRADDNADAVKNRINGYLPQIELVCNYFQDKSKVVEINGEGTVEEVAQEISQKL